MGDNKLVAETVLTEAIAGALQSVLADVRPSRKADVVKMLDVVASSAMLLGRVASEKNEFASTRTALLSRLERATAQACATDLPQGPSRDGT